MKTLVLRLCSRLEDLKSTEQQMETISMANMPLAPQSEPSTLTLDNGPKLHITGDPVISVSNVPGAKKSLDFSSATIPMEQQATAPTEQSVNALGEQVTVFNTAVQTAAESPTNAETGISAGGATGTSLQTCQVAKHPNAVKCREERQLRRVFLPTELVKGKQFRPRTPPIHKKEYPIIQFLADSHFQDMATQIKQFCKIF